MRDLMRLGSSALALLGIMFVGSLGLWVGIPLGWLWIAAQVQVATDSLGAAIGAAFLGVLVSIAAAVALLSRLSGFYRRQRIARGLDDTGNLALEAVMVISAVLAATAFGAWFFLFSGADLFPLVKP